MRGYRSLPRALNRQGLSNNLRQAHVVDIRLQLAMCKGVPRPRWFNLASYVCKEAPLTNTSSPLRAISCTPLGYLVSPFHHCTVFFCLLSLHFYIFIYGDICTGIFRRALRWSLQFSNTKKQCFPCIDGILFPYIAWLESATSATWIYLVVSTLS